MNSDGRPPLLSVRDLRVAFPTPSGPLQAIDGVSFDIAPREVLGVVGESGSGKSVTALSLMRLLPDSARVDGGIEFNGVDVLGMPGRRAAAAARQARLDDLPGPDDVAEPGAHHRRAARRDDAHAPRRQPPGSARAGRGAARRGRHPRSPAVTSTSIRTSSAAACASA